jgi:hypothetical protein
MRTIPMANIKAKVGFEVVEFQAGSGWYVRATLPHGKELQLGHFKTDIDAREWVKRRSSVWLKKLGKAKGAHSLERPQPLAVSGPSFGDGDITFTRTS